MGRPAADHRSLRGGSAPNDHATPWWFARRGWLFVRRLRFGSFDRRPFAVIPTRGTSSAVVMSVTVSSRMAVNWRPLIWFSIFFRGHSLGCTARCFYAHQRPECCMERGDLGRAVPPDAAAFGGYAMCAGGTGTPDGPGP